MSDRTEWASLCNILQEVQDRSSPVYTELVFAQVLDAVRDRLKALTFSYVVPARVSLQQAEALVVGFLAERSGGDRGLAVLAALFETFAADFGLYTEIRRGRVNAADAATGAAGDLECLGRDGVVKLAVEVKERRISLADVHGAVAKARGLGVKELLLCTHGVEAAETEAVAADFAKVWASGTNIYHLTAAELMHASLPLLGEGGIRDFIVRVGEQLDKFSTQPLHRKGWKSRLDGL